MVTRARDSRTVMFLLFNIFLSLHILSLILYFHSSPIIYVHFIYFIFLMLFIVSYDVL